MERLCGFMNDCMCVCVCEEGEEGLAFEPQLLIVVGIFMLIRHVHRLTICLLTAVVM